MLPWFEPMLFNKYWIKNSSTVRIFMEILMSHQSITPKLLIWCISTNILTVSTIFKSNFIENHCGKTRHKNTDWCFYRGTKYCLKLISLWKHQLLEVTVQKNQLNLNGLIHPMQCNGPLHQVPLMDDMCPPNPTLNIVLHTITCGRVWMDKDGQLNFY